LHGLSSQPDTEGPHLHPAVRRAVIRHPAHPARPQLRPLPGAQPPPGLADGGAGLRRLARRLCRPASGRAAARRANDGPARRARLQHRDHAVSSPAMPDAHDRAGPHRHGGDHGRQPDGAAAPGRDGRRGRAGRSSSRCSRCSPAAWCSAWPSPPSAGAGWRRRANCPCRKCATRPRSAPRWASAPSTPWCCSARPGCRTWPAPKGMYVVALASGLTDVDAITLSSLRLFSLDKLSAGPGRHLDRPRRAVEPDFQGGPRRHPGRLGAGAPHPARDAGASPWASALGLPI
jgi:hypothetical protein